MKQKRKSGRKLLSFLLALVMVVGLMPGIGLTVLADEETPAYANLKNSTNVVKFDSKDWYLIYYDDSSVTLLTKECVGASVFNPKEPDVNTYSGSTVESFVNSWYTEKISTDAKAAVNGSGMFLLTDSQASNLSTDVLKCSQASGAYSNHWWTCTPGTTNSSAVLVDGSSGKVAYSGNVWIAYGVRPALKLDLSKVVFDADTNTFSLKPSGYSVTITGGANATTSGGATSQTGLTDAMTTVTYTANTGYYFEDFTDITNNGITATRTSDTVVTVFGKPTADATITVSDAVEKTAATVTKAPAAKTLTYTGSAQELVTAGTATGGTMQYALGTDATTAPANNLYTTFIPTATNAGTYYVWYKAVGDDAHSDSNPAVVTVTISEESPAEPETDGKTETEQEGSALDDEKTSIDNDLTEIREIVSGEAQVEVEDSDTVRLILNTNSVDENSDENKEAVDSIKSMIEADNLNIGSFLDITLSYIVEDANGAEKSSGQLAELNGRSLSVRFPIPSKLQASGRLFRIFRFHDGKAEEIGSGKGDAVVLSLDKFSLYAIAYEDGAAPEETEESEKKVVKPHTHNYAWDKVEATESQDGELRYQCTECYDILVRVPLSAYYVFNANTVDKINKAKQGETVKITTDRWISFHKMVFDALAARPDVSLEVSFLDGEYKGKRVSFTIPAGADNSDLFTENNFAGFMYLGNKYGLTAEEN